MSYHGYHSYNPTSPSSHDQGGGYIYGDRLPPVTALPTTQSFSTPDGNYGHSSNTQRGGCSAAGSSAGRRYQTSDIQTRQWQDKNQPGYANVNGNYQSYGQAGVREQQSQKLSHDYQKPQSVDTMSEVNAGNNEGWYGAATSMPHMISSTQALSNLAYASILNSQQYSLQNDQSSSWRSDGGNSLNGDTSRQGFAQDAVSSTNYNRRYAAFGGQTSQLHQPAPDSAPSHQPLPPSTNFSLHVEEDRMSSRSPHHLNPMRPQQKQNESPVMSSQQILNRPSNPPRALFVPPASSSFPEDGIKDRDKPQKDHTPKVPQPQAGKPTSRQGYRPGRAGRPRSQQRSLPVTQTSPVKNTSVHHHPPSQKLPPVKIATPPPEPVMPPPNQTGQPKETPQSHPAPAPMPSYIDPTQVFNPYHREHERYKREEEQRARRESTGTSKGEVVDAVETPDKPPATATPQRTGSTQADVKTQTEKQSGSGQVGAPDPNHPVSPNTTPSSSAADLGEGGIAEEMQAMIQRMQEMKAKEPSLFKKVWADIRKVPAVAQGIGATLIKSPNLSAVIPHTPTKAATPQPQTSSITTEPQQKAAAPTVAPEIPNVYQSVNLPPTAGSKRKRDPKAAPRKQGRQPKATAELRPPKEDSLSASTAPAAPNFPRPGDSTAIRIFQTDGPSEAKSKVGGASQDEKKSPKPLSVPATQSRPAVRGPVKAVPPPPPTSFGGLLWPLSKRCALAEAAQRALLSLEANKAKSIQVGEIEAMLALNPSYMELCQKLEGRGFTFNRSHFAKFLLKNVPDLGVPLPPSNKGSPQPFSGAVHQPALDVRSGLPPQPQQVSAQQLSRGQPFPQQTPVQYPLSSTFPGQHSHGSQPLVGPPSALRSPSQMVPPQYPTPGRMQVDQAGNQILSGPQGPPMAHIPVTAPSPTHLNPTNRTPEGRSPKSRLGVPSAKIPVPAPGSKEANARKRDFSELVDLSLLSDDEDEEDLPAKLPRQDQGPENSFFGVKTGDPGPVAVNRVAAPPSQTFSSQPLRFPQPHAQPPGAPPLYPRHAQNALPARGPGLPPASQSTTPQRCQNPLAKPINKAEALRKSYYDPKTIARDVLIAAGRHPVQHPLNAHLSSFVGKTVDMDSDLSTFDWDSVDPGGPAMPVVAVVDIPAGPPRWKLGDRIPMQDSPPPAPGLPKATFIHSPANPKSMSSERSSKSGHTSAIPEKSSPRPSNGNSEPPGWRGAAGHVSHPRQVPTKQRGQSMFRLKGSIANASDAAASVPLITSDVAPNRVKKPSHLRKSINLNEEVNGGILATDGGPLKRSGADRPTTSVVEPTPKRERANHPPKRRGRIHGHDGAAENHVTRRPRHPPQSAPHAAAKPQFSTFQPQYPIAFKSTTASPLPVEHLRSPSAAVVLTSGKAQSEDSCGASSLHLGNPSEVGSSPARRGRGRPRKHPVMPLKTEPARRGRPPGRKNKITSDSDSAAPGIMSQVQVELDIKSSPPSFNIYECKWKECNAQLHNLLTLRKHVSRIHLVSNENEAPGKGLPCWWTSCRTHMVKESNGIPKVTFNSLKDLNEHIATDHYHPLGVKYGDGPSAAQFGKPQTDFNVSHFTYNPDKTPSGPSPPLPAGKNPPFPILFNSNARHDSHTDEQTQSDDRTVFLSDEQGRSVIEASTFSSIQNLPPDTLALAPTSGNSEANIPKQAFFRAHGNDKMDNRRTAIETLLSIQKGKERAGPSLDRDGCILATLEWRENFVQDLQINRVVGEDF